MYIVAAYSQCSTIRILHRVLPSLVSTNCSSHNLVSVPVTSVRSNPLVVSQANSHDLVKYDWTKERAAITEMNSTPVGGRLKFKWQNWKHFGASKMIVRLLRKGYMLPFNLGRLRKRSSRTKVTQRWWLTIRRTKRKQFYST